MATESILNVAQVQNHFHVVPRKQCLKLFKPTASVGLMRPALIIYAHCAQSVRTMATEAKVMFAASCTPPAFNISASIKIAYLQMKCGSPKSGIADSKSSFYNIATYFFALFNSFFI